MKYVDLTRAAEDDLTGIWSYTDERWGPDQADTYFDQIAACCEAIGTGDVRHRPVAGMADGIRVHRCRQHYIFFLEGARPIILAILHGRMDFVKRLQDRF